MKTIIREHLSAIRYGKMQQHENMTVLPLLSDLTPRTDYLSMKEAMQKGLLRITEIDESGSVPTLKAIYTGEVPVLLLQGEEIEGAMQNRVFNTTILLKENSETRIPVSCTELGRWSYRTGGYGYEDVWNRIHGQFASNRTEDYEDAVTNRQFAGNKTEDYEDEVTDRRFAGNRTDRTEKFHDSDIVMPSFARHSMARSVSDSLLFSEIYRSDQRAVWDNISTLSRRASVQSPTSAMRDVFTERRSDISEYTDTFRHFPGQRGILVFVNGRVKGLDMLSRQDAYEACHDKLLKGYAMEAMIAEKTGSGEPAAREDGAFIRKAAACDEKKHASVGLGDDYWFEGDGLVGSALVYGEEVVHVTFLPQSNLGTL